MAYQRALKKIKFTKEGFTEVQNEIEQIKNDRPAAVKELARAREMGDLSENGLYTAAKARLRSMDSQLRRLETQLKLADVIDTKKITVLQNNSEVTYEIVGDFEANPAEKRLSDRSPIGSALKYAVPGEEVKIETPKGTQILKVIKVA